MNNCVDVIGYDNSFCVACFQSIDVCKCIWDHVRALKKWKEVAIEKNVQDVNRIRELEKQVRSLTEMYKEISISYAKITDLEIGKLQAKPHKCPVCDGTGKDKNRLVAQPYDQSMKILVNPQCHSCQGKGIVWNE